MHPFRLFAAALALAAALPAIPRAQSWSPLAPAAGPVPPARRNASAIHDPVANRMIVFGGFGATYMNDIWAFDLDTHAWTNLTPASGPAPAPRLTPASVYDPAGHRMITWSGQGPGVFFNDVWAFDLDTHAWSQFMPAGTLPNVRYGVGVAFDAAAEELVTFAGFTNQGRFDDVWRFDGTSVAWSNVSPAVGPIERCLHAACYDAVGGRMIMYGGQNAGPLDDIWSLDLDTNTWTELTPATRPAGRYFTALVYDANNRRATIFGGQTASAPTAEAWVFDLWTHRWTQLFPAGTAPSARWGAAGIHDAANDRMVVFGGYDGVVKNDVWALNDLSDTATGVGRSPAPAAVLHPNVPNPFNPSTTISYELPAATPVSLRIYDVAGRLVRTLAGGVAPAGAHTRQWDGRDDRGAAVASGVYILRLEAGGTALTRKMVLLK